jgi:hypothetical protein
VDKLKISRGNLVIVAAGAVTFLASFLTFFSVDLGPGLSHSYSAWDRGNFMMATLPALIGLVMAVQVAMATWTETVRVPERVLGLTWTQVHVALGAQAALLMVAWVVVNRDPLSRGMGFWLMALGSIALAVGAVLRAREPVPAA